MDDQKPPFAWQPLTPSGVAAFARATLGRLLLIQFLFALFAAGSIAWFLHRAWVPVITDAISQLPGDGEVRAGRLDWGGDSPVALAENHFLALTVDLKHEGEARSPAHMQIEFGEKDIKVFSLFGATQTRYPRHAVIAFNQTELKPWWGAWTPALLAITVLFIIAALFVSWASLSTLYFIPVWLLGLFSDRELTLGGSWRLAGAALMPGALFFTVGIIVYGLAWLELLQLVVVAGLHVVVGWAYLVFGVAELPRHTDELQGKTNPFH